MRLQKFFFTEQVDAKEAIAEEGIKQKHIAAKLEISEPHLSRMLNGYQNMADKYLEGIEKLLHRSSGSLFINGKKGE